MELNHSTTTMINTFFFIWIFSFRAKYMNCCDRKENISRRVHISLWNSWRWDETGFNQDVSKHGMSMTPLIQIKLHVLFGIIASRSGAWATSVPNKLQGKWVPSFSPCSHSRCVQKTSMKPEFLQCQHRQMMQYLVTQSWTICLWAARETNHGPTTSLKHGKDLLRLQYRRHHHTFENVLSDCKETSLCHPWRERSPKSLRLEKREDGDLSPHWKRDACYGPSSGSTSTDSIGFVALSRRTSQGSVQRNWEACCTMAEQFAQLDQHVS